MMFKNKTAHKSVVIILFACLVCSLMSYEKHVYETLYYVALFATLCIGVLPLLLINFKVVSYNFVKENLIVLILIFLKILAGIISTFNEVHIDYWLPLEVMTTISIVVFYLLLPYFFKSELVIAFDLVFKIIVITAIISIIISLKGNFLGYEILWGTRSASIYFDANYCGLIMAIAVAYFLYGKSKYCPIYALICLFGLISTGSRASLLSLFVVVLMDQCVKLIVRKQIVTIISVIIVVIFCLNLIDTLTDALAGIEYFRAEQGSNGRLDLWRWAWEVISNAPFFGYGYGSLQNLLHNSGLPWASTHNSYIDYIVMFGIPSFLVYITIILIGIYRGLNKIKIHENLFCCIGILVINANFISVNVGGFGFLSCIFTLMLGIMNSIADNKK